MNSLSTKPFAKKFFFLDLKDFPNKKKLIKDLELLGAKEEICLNKNVSFVVSDKVPIKPEFKVPSAPYPGSKSPLLFKDSPLNNVNSPVAHSPKIDQKAPSESLMPMSRTQSLLLKAKEKSQVGTKNLTEICKQWNIKVYPLQKVLSWIEKYKCKYYKSHTDKKKHEVPSENAQKIYSPFIKFEDVKRKYKPKYKSFNSWTTAVDGELLQSMNKIVKSFKLGGNVLDPFRPTLKENSDKAKLGVLNLVRSSFKENGDKAKKDKTVIRSPLCSRNASFKNETASVSRIFGHNSISNSVSACGSKAINEENLHNKKAKKDKQQKKAKKPYCEICGVHFTDSDGHYEKQSHIKFMDNSSNFKEVQDIISSLPQAEDFLASLQKDEQEKESHENIQLFDGPRSLDVPSDENTLSNKLPDLNTVDLDVTEAYSLNADDYISDSCSSSPTSLPYLEKMVPCIPAKGSIGPDTFAYYKTLNTEDAFVSKNILLKPPTLTFNNSYNMCDQSLYADTPLNLEKGNISILCNNAADNYGSDVNGSIDMQMGNAVTSHCLGDSFQHIYGNKMHLSNFRNNILAFHQMNSLYQSPIDLNSLYLEVPLDLSSTSKQGIICHNYTSVNDSANIIDAGKILNNHTSIIDPEKASNDTESTITIDVTKISNDSPGTVDLTTEVDSTSAVRNVSSNDGVCGVAKALNIDDASKAIDVSNISNDKNLVGAIDIAEIQNSILSREPDNAQPLSSLINLEDKMNSSNYNVGNSDENTEICISEPESDEDIHVMVADCLSQVDKSLESDDMDSSVKELNNKPQHLDGMVDGSVNPIELVQIGEVPIPDSKKEFRHKKFDAKYHLCNELNEIPSTEPSVVPRNSPTKRKYFDNVSDYNTEKLNESSNVSNCTELPELSVMRSPAKKIHFQKENINCESFYKPTELLSEHFPLSKSCLIPGECPQTENDMSCQFDNSIVGQSTEDNGILIKSIITETNMFQTSDTVVHYQSCQKLIEISDLEKHTLLNASFIAGDSTDLRLDNLSSYDLSNSKNYAGIIKEVNDSLPSRKILPKLLYSDDTFIVLDETVDSEDDFDNDFNSQCDVSFSGNEASNVDEKIENKTEYPYLDKASETQVAFHNQIEDPGTTDVVIRQDKSHDVCDNNQDVHEESNLVDKTKVQSDMENLHDDVQDSLNKVENDEKSIEMECTTTESISKMKEDEREKQNIENVHNGYALRESAINAKSVGTEHLTSSEVTTNENCEENVLENSNNISHCSISSSEMNATSCCEIRYLYADSTDIIPERELEVYKTEEICQKKVAKNKMPFLHTTQFSRSTSVSSDETVHHPSSCTSFDSQSNCNYPESSVSSSNENNSSFKEVNDLSTSSPNGYGFAVTNYSTNVMESNQALHIVYLNSAAQS